MSITSPRGCSVVPAQRRNSDETLVQRISGGHDNGRRCHPDPPGPGPSPADGSTGPRLLSVPSGRAQPGRQVLEHPRNSQTTRLKYSSPSNTALHTGISFCTTCRPFLCILRPTERAPAIRRTCPVPPFRSARGSWRCRSRRSRPALRPAGRPEAQESPRRRSATSAGAWNPVSGVRAPDGPPRAVDRRPGRTVSEGSVGTEAVRAHPLGGGAVLARSARRHRWCRSMSHGDVAAVGHQALRKSARAITGGGADTAVG